MNYQSRYGDHAHYGRSRNLKCNRALEFKQEWRCQDCERLLGKFNTMQLQIRRKPLDYVVGFPVYATCPSCGALNAKTKA